ncbi:MAG TPA: pyridoxamine 5'-phosphate oxidase [Bacteroidales bacterium]|nr:pyridoxamine 5'-phosphate oxidase [Bacteroidales bacterium]
MMKKNRTLSENAVFTDPFKQFTLWYKERLSAVSQYPDAVCLATTSKEGRVSARMVLLKDFSESGFIFFTNYNSKKGKQLSENPYAAMLFYWPESGQQVRIEGYTEKVSAEESVKYFNSRPRDSQIGAWASEQSSVIPDRPYLDSRVEFFKKKYSGKSVEKPEYWGGFRLVPDSIEFWQEGEYRLHDRIRYTRKDESWIIERLAP